MSDGGWRQRWTALGLLLGLAVAVHLLLPQLTTLEGSLAVVRQLRWGGVVAAITAQVMSYVASSVMVQGVAALAGATIRLPSALTLLLAAGAAGTLGVGPVAYVASSIRWAPQLGLPREAGVLCGWLPNVLNAVPLLLLATWGSIALIGRHAPSHPTLRFVLVSLLLASTVAAVAIWGVRLSLASRLRALETHRTHALGGLVGRRAWGITWGPAWGGAVGNTLFDLLTVAALFSAAGMPLPLATLVAGYGLPQVAGRLGLLPGGLGIVEGGMVGAYVVLGAPHTTCVLVVLAYRLVAFWMPLAIGGILALRLERQRRRAIGT